MPRRSKFGAVRCEVDGLSFDSKMEARRWSQLVLMERAGQVSALARQVHFPLYVGDIRIGDYVADFVYQREPDGERVIEDAKGVLTPLCAWKLKHMEAQGRTVTLWPPRKPKRRKTKCSIPQ